MDVLNVASTGMYMIVASIVNFKRNTRKKWTSSLKLVVMLAQRRYALIVCNEYLNAVTYNDTYTNLTLDKNTEQFDI